MSATGALFQATAGFKSLSGVENTPGNSQLSGLFGSTDLAGFFNNLFKFAITLGAIIAVVQLVIAGYLYMGRELWATKQQAREKFKNVITGLLLLLSLWLILYKINPDLVNLDVLHTIQSENPSQSLQAPPVQPPLSGDCPPDKAVRDPNTGICL